MADNVIFEWREVEGICEVLLAAQRLLEEHDDDGEVLDYLCAGTLQDCRHWLSRRLDQSRF
jgi:hypothetical protein